MKTAVGISKMNDTGVTAIATTLARSYKNSSTLPLELFSVKAFSTYITQNHPDVAKGLTGRRRSKNELEIYKSVLDALSREINMPILSYKNVASYANRLQLHYAKYGHYIKAFAEAMGSKTDGTYGIVIAVKNATMTTPKPRNYKVISDRTSILTVDKWLGMGKVVLIDATSPTLQSSFASYEMYDEKHLSTAESYMPKLGFGGIMWSSHTSNLSSDVISTPGAKPLLKQLQWLLAWQVNLPAAPSDCDLPMSIEAKYPKAIKLTLTTGDPTGKVLVKGVITILVSDYLAAKLAKSKNRTFKLTTDLLQFGDQVRKISSSAEYLEIKKSLSYAICDDFSSDLPNMSTSIISGKYDMLSHAPYTGYINMCRQAMSLRDKGAIYKIVLLANKGQGKSTLIQKMRELSASNGRLFIEDSDDWGKFLSYASSTSSQPSLELLDQALTDTKTIDLVTQFYSLTEEVRATIPSYFNVMAEAIVSQLMASYDQTYVGQFSRSVRAQLLFDYITARSLPLIRTTFINATKLKHLNEKVFEDGIYQFMEAAGCDLYVAMLHIYLDNVKRRNHDQLFRFTNGFDSYMSQALRALDKNATTESYLADYTLKLLYENAEDRSIPLIPVSEVLKLLGYVSFVDDALNLVVAPLSQ